MKKISLSLFLAFINIVCFSQQKITIDSNSNRQELSQTVFYSHIQPYENENFFYIGFPTMYPCYKGILVILNKKQKVRKVISVGKTLNDNLSKNNSSFYIVNTTQLNYKRKELKSLGKQLRSIVWNKYYKEAYSNFYCTSDVDSSLEYQQKKQNTLNVDDGFGFYCVLKIGQKYRLLNFYIWEDFVSICNNENHRKVLKLMQKLIFGKNE